MLDLIKPTQVPVKEPEPIITDDGLFPEASEDADVIQETPPAPDSSAVDSSSTDSVAPTQTTKAN